jgi:hypothetical protein
LKLSCFGKIWVFWGIFQGDVGFGGENGGWWVNLHGLGRIDKEKSVKKCAKTFENIRKVV